MFMDMVVLLGMCLFLIIKGVFFGIIFGNFIDVGLNIFNVFLMYVCKNGKCWVFVNDIDLLLIVLILVVLIFFLYFVYVVGCWIM